MLIYNHKRYWNGYQIPFSDVDLVVVEDRGVDAGQPLILRDTPLNRSGPLRYGSKLNI